MTEAAIEPRPAKMHLREKNRAWGKNRARVKFAYKIPSQVPEGQQENAPRSTGSASGVKEYGFRYYSPGAGRWISRDPIGERGGVNLYGFVENRPINAIDVKGTSSRLIKLTTDQIYRRLAVSTGLSVGSVGVLAKRRGEAMLEQAKRNLEFGCNPTTAVTGARNISCFDGASLGCEMCCSENASLAGAAIDQIKAAKVAINAGTSIAVAGAFTKLMTMDYTLSDLSRWSTALVAGTGFTFGGAKLFDAASGVSDPQGDVRRAEKICRAKCGGGGQDSNGGNGGQRDYGGNTDAANHFRENGINNSATPMWTRDDWRFQ